MHSRAVNLLGALAVSLGDELESATEHAAEHGSAAPAALATLLRRPGLSIESLRSRVELSHSATVRLVDRLVDDGLVVRRPGDDHRTVGLHLTAKGRRRGMRVLQARRAVLSRAVTGLSSAEVRQLEGLLDRLLRTQAVQRDDARSICRLCEVPVCPLRRCPVAAGR